MSTKQMWCLVAVAMLVVAAPLFAQRSNVQYSDSAYSTVSFVQDSIDDYVRFTTIRTTQSYHIQEYWKNYRDQNSIPVIIGERSTQSFISGSEGESGLVVLTGKVCDKGNFDKVAWTDSLSANLVEYNVDYFETTLYGCCAAESEHILYRYQGGKELLRMTDALYTISIPNTPTKRYLGFQSNAAAEDYPDIRDSQLCGVITYVDPSTLHRQRLVIDFIDKKLYDSLAIGSFDSITFSPREQIDIDNMRQFRSFGDRELTLWSQNGNADPSGVSGFTVNLYLLGSPAPVAQIPITNDRIDSRSLNSKDFRFEMR